ncbi:MAG: hypothetical protein ACTHKF_06805, partial [Candidatus Nitrosocosmicus sp.]
EGDNKITAKSYCLNNPQSKYYSVNVTGSNLSPDQLKSYNSSSVQQTSSSLVAPTPVSNIHPIALEIQQIKASSPSQFSLPVSNNINQNFNNTTPAISNSTASFGLNNTTPAISNATASFGLNNIIPVVSNSTIPVVTNSTLLGTTDIPSNNLDSNNHKDHQSTSDKPAKHTTNHSPSIKPIKEVIVKHIADPKPIKPIKEVIVKHIADPKPIKPIKEVIVNPVKDMKKKTKDSGSNNNNGPTISFNSNPNPDSNQGNKDMKKKTKDSGSNNNNGPTISFNNKDNGASNDLATNIINHVWENLAENGINMNQ